MAQRIIRNFIIGKDQIPSMKVYRQAILRGQLAMILFSIGILYIIIDLSYGITRNIPLYLACIVIASISFWMNRRKLFRYSTILLLTLGNGVIYVLASSEPSSSGVYVFFIPAALGALALFSYSDWYWGLGLILLSLTLFLCAYLVDFSVLPYGNYTVEYDRVNFIINFSIAGTVSVLIVYFLINLNHHSEKTLKQNEERLEKVNAELDRFVYSASHDLRAPLSSLLGLVGLAEKTNEDQEVSVYHNMMRNRIHALENFIRDIIDYSRNARVDVQNEICDLNELVGDVMDNLRFAEELSSIKIKTNIPNNFTLYSDKVRFRIVLNNLLSNALKYHDKTKELKYVSISAMNRGAYKEIIIDDNGIGIDAEQLPKIFDMFYRASEHSKGSGLGLYIARETVKKLGGEILVKSKAGEGTSFILQFPG